MSKSEKRYFKLFVLRNSAGKSNNYLKVFDLIEKAGTAEKQAVEKLCEDKNFMQKQFRSYKNRLYDQILKSLSLYHSQKVADDEIMELIRQAKILYYKSLYTHAKLILEKAENIARKYEKFIHLLEIIQWQKKIMMTSELFEKTSYKTIIQLTEEEERLIKKIDNNNKYWKINARLYLFYRINGEANNQDNINEYTSFIKEPILVSEDLALSYSAKVHYYSIFIQYYGAIKNLAEAFNYIKSKPL